MRFAYPWMLLGLLLLPLVWWLESRRAAWRRRAAERFAESALRPLLLPPAPRVPALRASIWSLALAAAVLALARPQGAPVLSPRNQPVLRIYFLVDCSDSMLAQDLRPNRLQTAKRLVQTLADRLPGDRLGLIAFAGTPRELCPPTVDHAALSMALSQVSPGVPEEAGSDPGAAIALGRENFARVPGRNQVMILLSDGEATPEEGTWWEEAREAGRAGIRLYAVGTGTETGAPIPQGTDFWGKPQYRMFAGKRVQTRLQPLTLHKAAAYTGGAYLKLERVSTTAAQLSSRLNRLQRDLERRRTILGYREWFPWAMALALLAWWLDAWWPLRRRRPA